MLFSKKEGIFVKTAAIICEYNPLHRGHAKQYAMLREALGENTCIVCLMSGNYVQRGEPAVFDAAVRAKAAVLSGANVVLELPITAALSSAEGFAFGGVEALHRLGGVDALCFGCESGDGNKIMSTAKLLRSPAFSEALREGLGDGDSFAALRQRTLEALDGDGSVLRNPNDILAVEYCKALLALDSKIAPLAITRCGSYHDTAPDPENPSATALRGMIPREDWLCYVPQEDRELFSNAAVHRMAWGERAMLARLRAMKEDDFEALPYGAEGLWRKLMAQAQQADSIEHLIDGVKSRRYARSRIARMVMCAFLGITEADLKAPTPYVRVLAFDGTGRKFLRQAADRGGMPMLHPGEKARGNYADLERRASALYPLFLSPERIPAIPTGERVFSKPEP